MERERIPQLDGLRAIAITAVFFSHMATIRMLWIGVDLFFVLSGFLITGILLDMKTKDVGSYFRHFYERRVRRILPPYLLLLVVTSLVFGAAWAHRWYWYIGLTNYITFSHDPYFQPFDPLWSLGVEEQFYLIWPVVVYYLRPRQIVYFGIGLMILAPILRVLALPYDSTHGHWLIYKGTPFRMDCLAMGSLLTFVWRKHSDKVKKYGYLGLIIPLTTPLLMMQLSKIGGFSTIDMTVRGSVFTYEIALWTATGAFLWGLGGRFTGILTFAPIRWLGRISYTFYLIFCGALFFWGARTEVRWKLAVLAFSTSVAYAAISWYWIEKPILAGGNRRSKQIELAAAQKH